MKVSILAALTCTLIYPVLMSAPYDPPTAASIVRLDFNSRLRPWTNRTPALNLFFNPVPGASAAGSLLSPSAYSQPPSDIQRGDDNSTGSPSYFKPVLFFGGALATTAILIRTDQTTYNALHRWRNTNDPIEDISPVITNLGDGRTSVAIFGGFLAYSYIGNDKSAFQAGKIGLESFLVSGIATQILKHTFGRERPSDATQSGGRWNGAFFLLNQGSGKRGGYARFDAFPSGHTATAFAAATTISDVYGDSPWVSYTSYAVASSVAISRVMERTHWLSDCFIGGLIGYFSAKLVLHYNHMDKPVALVPMYDSQQMGLAVHVGL